ncbi:unnamed protein product, partial [Rotaria sp. Silwood1]
ERRDIGDRERDLDEPDEDDFDEFDDDDDDDDGDRLIDVFVLCVYLLTSNARLILDKTRQFIKTHLT